MRSGAVYSHLNGLEWIKVHAPGLWDEVQHAIASVDADACKTKMSREKTMRGKLLYSPGDMNAAFKKKLDGMGWQERRNTFWVTSDENLLRNIYNSSPDSQKSAIIEAGHTPIQSYNQTDFVKDNVAIEIQFGKYAFVAHDLFVKHLSFYVSGTIEVGIEVLPMKSLESEMSSGVPYYERDLLNLIRQGRGVPAVPLVLVGIKP